MAKSISVSDTNKNSSLPTTSKATHKNRRSLLLLLTVFVLPILLAKLALDNQWLSLGVTNQGELITQPITLDDLGIDEVKFSKQWLIIYRLPDACPATCLHSIEAVHNSYVALGKDMPRVTPVLVKRNIFSAEQQKQLAKSQWQILALTPKMSNQINTAKVLIADPLGNIILSHSLPEQEQQLASFGKAIVADMKKLLKYSKVG